MSTPVPRSHTSGRTPRFHDGGAFLLIVILLALFVRAFLVQPFSIPGGSMEPALRIGDHMFASKRAYGYGPYSLPFGLGETLWDKETARTSRTLPERGDVAVFCLPSDTRVDYVKRVIGLPGDHVQLKQGRVILNNVPIALRKIGTFKLETGRRTELILAEETLPSGRRYFVLDMAKPTPADDTKEFFVPPGHLFVLGDNRDNSLDSRFDKVGFIPLENLVGRAALIYSSRHAERIMTWVR